MRRFRQRRLESVGFWRAGRACAKRSSATAFQILLEFCEFRSQNLQGSDFSSRKISCVVAVHAYAPKPLRLRAGSGSAAENPEDSGGLVALAQSAVARLLSRFCLNSANSGRKICKEAIFLPEKLAAWSPFTLTHRNRCACERVPAAPPRILRILAGWSRLRSSATAMPTTIEAREGFGPLAFSFGFRQ